MNKDVAIICESLYHNNTMKIAKAMAIRLNCRILSYYDAVSCDLSKYKVIGLGSGIFFGSHHPELVKIAGRLKKDQTAFIFSTHGAPFVGKYHNTIKDVLKKNEVSIAGEFSCKGYDGTGPFLIYNGGNKGRPHEGDCLKAEKFIMKTFPSYCADIDTVHNGRYVEVNKDKCIGCMVCINTCPMKVFEYKNGISVPVNATDCIHCLLCRDNCPEGAIAVHHTYRDAIAIAKRHSKKTSLY